MKPVLINQCVTTHKLDFLVEAAPPGSSFMLYQIGTCHGQWCCTVDAYVIVSIVNEVAGNGHLDDVFEWFNHVAKREGKNLIVVKIMTVRFFKHLVFKRRFVALDQKGKNCIRIHNMEAYKSLLKSGNAILTPGTLDTR